MNDERRAFASAAMKFATIILGGTPRTLISPSDRVRLFEDANGTRMVAVANPGEEVGAGARILACALATRGDRKLDLVLPPHLVAQSQSRLAWVDGDVQTWRYAKDDLEELDALYRDDVLSSAKEAKTGTKPPYEVPEPLVSWVSDLVAGMKDDGLQEHHRSCWSLHKDGLQVLRITATKRPLKLSVVAGVNYKKPPEGHEPVRIEFTEPPTSDEIAAIKGAVLKAVANGSLTSQMVEHEFQAHLARPDAKGVMGFSELRREVPVVRLGCGKQGGNGSGMIDLVGVTGENHLHVVEVKVGGDPGVALQALDYAIWMRAHEGDLRPAWGLNPAPPGRRDTSLPPIDLVLANHLKGKKAVDRYLAAVIGSLSDQIKQEMRVWVCANPLADPLILERLTLAELWEASEYCARPLKPPR